MTSACRKPATQRHCIVNDGLTSMSHAPARLGLKKPSTTSSVSLSLAEHDKVDRTIIVFMQDAA